MIFYQCHKLFRFYSVLTKSTVRALCSTERCSYVVYRRIKSNMRLLISGHMSTLHTSAYLCKRRKTPEERKVSRILEYPKVKGDIVSVWKDMTLNDLAKVLDRDISYTKELFLNHFKDPNTVLDDMKVIQQGVRRSGHRMIIIANPNKQLMHEEVDQDIYPRAPAPQSLLKPRPPVVTIMGHVDHGKTTLLDALRHSKVVEQEFGGITQHIGAFTVKLATGATITFLDTPGHAAFSNMRERGAFATDIVVLVVAADDGVMEQTIESVRMARDAKVPILVAINKIDSPKADVARTERMLTEIGIHTESQGGDVQAIPISALKKQNLNQLAEALAVQAEIMEIKADPTGAVEGVVIESRVDLHRGKLCTVIVQRGTLKKGCILVAGTSIAKVRVMRAADTTVLTQVPPGNPVEVEGWKELPSPGDTVLEVDSERQAREVTRIRTIKKDQEKQCKDAVVIAEKATHHQTQYKERLMLKRSLGRFRLKPEGPRKPEIGPDDPTPALNLIVKSDVDGTLEALLNTLDTYDLPECKLNLVHYGVGDVTDNDLELAGIFNGIIYAFNVKCPKKIQEEAEAKEIVIKHLNVIYKLVDDVKEEINKRLPEQEVEDVIGEAVVLQQFEIDIKRKKVAVAGCRCTKGLLRKTANYKLMRNLEVVHVGHLSTMRHLKEDVDVIKVNTECGLQLSDKTVTYQPGDTLICFQIKTLPQKTAWDPGF